MIISFQLAQRSKERAEALGQTRPDLPSSPPTSLPRFLLLFKDLFVQNFPILSPGTSPPRPPPRTSPTWSSAWMRSLPGGRKGRRRRRRGSRCWGGQRRRRDWGVQALVWAPSLRLTHHLHPLSALLSHRWDWRGQNWFQNFTKTMLTCCSVHQCSFYCRFFQVTWNKI